MKRVALYAAALGFVVFAGFPFYWMLITSFKQNRDLYVGASVTSHIPWLLYAIDVAVHPDSAEGRAVMDWLRRAGLSFIAFRGAMSGAATGAHIHVGQPSQRLALP